jgi:hypothetical protein
LRRAEKSGLVVEGDRLAKHPELSVLFVFSPATGACRSRARRALPTITRMMIESLHQHIDAITDDVRRDGRLQRLRRPRRQGGLDRRALDVIRRARAGRLDREPRHQEEAAAATVLAERDRRELLASDDSAVVEAHEST